MILRRRIGSFVKPSAIARLWALRILVKLQGHRQLIYKHGFTDDSLAWALGLAKNPEFSEEIPKPKEIVDSLRKDHLQAENKIAKAKVPASLTRNVKQLARLANLTDTDCRLLEFAVLMNNDAVLGAAAGLITNVTSSHASTLLAVILDLPEDAIRASLHRDGMLLRSGILTISHETTTLTHKFDLISTEFAALAMEPEMEPAALLRGVAARAAPAELQLDEYPHLQPTLDLLVPYLRHARSNGQSGVNVFLHGPPGTGKTQLVRALASHMSCDLFEVAIEDESGDPIAGPKRLCALRAAQCFFSKGGALVVFDEAEDIFHDGGLFSQSTAQKNKGWLNRMLETNAAPTLWLSNRQHGLDPAFVRRFDMVIELPVPPRQQRQRTARVLCGDLVDDATLERLADCDVLAPAVVARATHVVRTIGADMNREQAGKAATTLIDSILTMQGHKPLHANDANRLPGFYDPAFINTDADLAGIADGLARTGAGRLCLYGPPGTGKTAYGRWLAQKLGKPLRVKRASDLISMWIGETEKNIADAFRSAERDGAILLIDEVDSFLRERADAQRSWEVTQVNEMLTQMEAFPGIFIASTNLMSGLDQAALRRFDLKLKFDYLRPAQALALLRKHCEMLDLQFPDLTEAVARQQLGTLTPGDFAAVMRRHRFRPVTSTSELVAALRAECAVKADARPAIGFVH